MEPIQLAQFQYRVVDAIVRYHLQVHRCRFFGEVNRRKSCGVAPNVKS